MARKKKHEILNILQDLLDGKITKDEACKKIHGDDEEDSGGAETQDSTGDQPPTGPKP